VLVRITTDFMVEEKYGDVGVLCKRLCEVGGTTGSGIEVDAFWNEARSHCSIDQISRILTGRLYR
jgi:hypothetical protein